MLVKEQDSDAFFTGKLLFVRRTTKTFTRAMHKHKNMLLWGSSIPVKDTTSIVFQKIGQ